MSVTDRFDRSLFLAQDVNAKVAAARAEAFLRGYAIDADLLPVGLLHTGLARDGGHLVSRPSGGPALFLARNGDSGAERRVCAAFIDGVARRDVEWEGAWRSRLPRPVIKSRRA